MIVTFSEPVESVRGKLRIGKGFYVKKMYGKYVLQRCPNRKGHIPTKKEKENQKKFIKQWKKKKKRRSSTERRYRSIERAVHLRLGTMPVMMVYATVAEELGVAEETVRRVMWERRRG
ncbi:MAG: hypothetical protein J6R26_02820 [Paludibacteraceae bacterium]|nr:hypothetical protein [Paludibacteraceae bacterium]